MDLREHFETSTSAEECLERIRGAIQPSVSFRVRPSGTKGAPFIGAINGDRFQLWSNGFLSRKTTWHLAGRIDDSIGRTVVHAEVNPPLPFLAIISVVVVVIAAATDRSADHVPFYLLWGLVTAVWFVSARRSARELMGKLRSLLTAESPPTQSEEL